MSKFYKYIKLDCIKSLKFEHMAAIFTSHFRLELFIMLYKK